MARLSLAHITKRFGAQAAVHDVSIDVKDGELMCLLGPSGCGKTTTLRIIGGFLAPDSGDIEIDGRSVAWLPLSAGRRRWCSSGTISGPT